MRHLRIYQAIRLIQRQGSIRKAADVLAVSPSALNRSLQAFEHELSTPVFDRIPGGVRLTAAGELLMDMVDRHLLAFDDLREQLTMLRDGVSGVLRVAVGSDIGAGRVLGALHAFEEAFPAVSVELDTDDNAASLRSREADLAVLTNPATDDAVEVLYAHPVRLVAWRSGRADAPEPEPKPGPPPGPGPASKPEGEPAFGLWTLMDGRVLLPPHGTGTRVAVSHLLRRHRLTPPVVSAVTAAQLAPLLAAGPRVALFAETVFEAGAFPPRLHQPPVALGDLTVSILRAARVPMRRQAQAFLTLLQRRLDAVPPADDTAARHLR